MKEQHLKPCPFCGDANNPQLNLKAEGVSCTHVQCESCGAIGPVWDTADMPEGAEKTGEVVRLWNQRVASEGAS